MKKLQLRLCFLVLFLLTPVFITSGAVCAESDAGSFYKGKVIKFVVPYTPGGGTDVYARLVAQYLQRYTKATIVVKNVPGAGGIVGYNHVYKAKPNGLTIAITDTPGVILAQLLGQAGVSVPLQRFTLLLKDLRTNLS